MKRFKTTKSITEVTDISAKFFENKLLVKNLQAIQVRLERPTMQNSMRDSEHTLKHVENLYSKGDFLGVIKSHHKT